MSWSALCPHSPPVSYDRWQRAVEINKDKRADERSGRRRHSQTASVYVYSISAPCNAAGELVFHLLRGLVIFSYLMNHVSFGWKAVIVNRLSYSPARPAVNVSVRADQLIEKHPRLVVDSIVYRRYWSRLDDDFVIILTLDCSHPSRGWRHAVVLCRKQRHAELSGMPLRSEVCLVHQTAA